MSRTITINKREIKAYQEIESLKAQLTQETKRREEAERVIDFYATNSSWLAIVHPEFRSRLFYEIDPTDICSFQYKRNDTRTIGGKRAREYNEKYRSGE